MANEKSDKLIIINKGRDLVWAKMIATKAGDFYLPKNIVGFFIPKKDVVIFDIFNSQHTPQNFMQG